jgi:hypothetical protein
MAHVCLNNAFQGNRWLRTRMAQFGHPMPQTASDTVGLPFPFFRLTIFSTGAT